MATIVFLGTSNFQAVASNFRTLLHAASSVLVHWNAPSLRIIAFAHHLIRKDSNNRCKPGVETTVILHRRHKRADLRFVDSGGMPMPACFGWIPFAETLCPQKVDLCQPRACWVPGTLQHSWIALGLLRAPSWVVWHYLSHDHVVYPVSVIWQTLNKLVKPSTSY